MERSNDSTADEAGLPADATAEGDPRKGIVWKSLLKDIPRRVVITDPELKRILNPGPSPECMVRIEELERMTRRGGW